MTETMTAAQYRALVAKKKRTKYGAEPVIDPETGQRVASKRELAMLRRLRAEADAFGYIVALQPRFPIEGGHAIFDAVEICLYGNDAHVIHGAPWYRAWVRCYDAKGKDLPAGRKNRRQVKQRYGVEVILE